MINSRLQEALEERGTASVVVESTVMAFLFVFGILGNFLVFCAVWRNRNLRGSSTNVFILGLAVSDILMSVLCMPLSLITLIHGRWMLGAVVCRIHGFCVFTFALASLNMMTLVSVNRYFCILKTAKYPRLFNKKRTIIYTSLVWCNTLIGSVPPFFFDVGGISFQPGKAMCLYVFEANIPFTVVLEIVNIGLPLLLIAFCYSSIFKTVYQRNRVFSTNPNATAAELRANVREAKITKTLATVFLGFSCCWIPVSVIDFIDVGNGEPVLARQAYLTYGFLVYISSTINPFIYGIASRSFRHEYSKMLRKIFCGFFCCYNKINGGNHSRSVEGTDPKTVQDKVMNSHLKAEK